MSEPLSRKLTREQALDQWSDRRTPTENDVIAKLLDDAGCDEFIAHQEDGHVTYIRCRAKNGPALTLNSGYLEVAPRLESLIPADWERVPRQNPDAWPTVRLTSFKGHTGRDKPAERVGAICPVCHTEKSGWGTCLCTD